MHILISSFIGKKALNKFFIVLTMVSFFIINPIYANALETYVIDKSSSTLKGWIKYSVVGKYHVAFNDFEGKIVTNASSKEIKSINLKIKASSLKSKFPKLDRIVRSKQVLHVEKFPDIVFESNDIRRRSDGSWLVKGKIILHGVTQEMNFLFKTDFDSQPKPKEKLTASGKWQIERKEFDIIWHKVLDKGGWVVGNHLNVDWNVTAVLDK